MLGIGGVLRNSGFMILCRFVIYMGYRESNEVEFFVIVYVLETIYNNSSYRGSKIFVEFDLVNVVVWVIDKLKCFWKFWFLYGLSNFD